MTQGEWLYLLAMFMAEANDLVDVGTSAELASEVQVDGATVRYRRRRRPGAEG